MENLFALLLRLPIIQGCCRQSMSSTNMLSKKSPMHKLARLARLAGTTIGRDALNSTGTSLLIFLEMKYETNSILAPFHYKKISIRKPIRLNYR